MIVEAHGPGRPDAVWRRLVDPSRWSSWAPQIRRVESDDTVLHPGVTGRVHGPAGIVVDYEITECDAELRAWSWVVSAGPVDVVMRHVVLPAPGGGSRALLQIHGASAVVAQAYRPIAKRALQRLVDDSPANETTDSPEGPLQTFDFAFSPRYAAAALPFGITPATTAVEVGAPWLYVRYGPWQLLTPRSNVVATHLTGGFSFIKTAGPPHLSFSDCGISMTTNGERALCLEFATPVSAIDTTGMIRHPGATLSVADPEGLAAALYGPFSA